METVTLRSHVVSVTTVMSVSKKSNNSEGQIQNSVFLKQEVTLHFLFDAIVICVLHDMKVKRNLMRTINKRHLVLTSKKPRFTFFEKTGCVSCLYDKIASAQRHNRIKTVYRCSL